MSSEDINRIIEDHIKRTAKLLPDGFEAEDLLEDLRSHIHESYDEKVQKNLDRDKIDLVRAVLAELGTPEEIAEEYSREQVEVDEEITSDKWIYYTMRLMVAVLVVVLASWVVSVITEGAVDFMLAVVVLLFFTVLESIVRAQQIKDA